MPKTIYTDIDIEEQAKEGVASISIDDNTLLTDLAFEKARQLGIQIVSNGHEVSSAAPIRPYLNNHTPRTASNGKANAVLQNTTGKPNNKPDAECTRDTLHFAPDASEETLRFAIVKTGQLLYESGLMISNDGNISVRMADGNIMITPSGVCKGRIEPQDLLIINLDGQLVKAASNALLKPTSEQPMHLEVYRQRPDVCAVIHTHLIYANALAISQGQVRMDVIPEAAIAFGEIPITDFSLPSSPQNAEAIRTLIQDHDVMLIRNHGSLTVGKTLDEALINLERLEHVSKTLTFAQMLGHVNTLPSDMLEAIAKITEQARAKK